MPLKPVCRSVCRKRSTPFGHLPPSSRMRSNVLSVYHKQSLLTGRSFWIWIPDYVAEAINAWKHERPSQQRELLDRKDREEVDFLFCYRERHTGVPFINNSVIPVLCKRAGVSIEDAKGKITGHRGRSTRLTLLQRNGVSLDDLAEYAGHANTKTIRRYISHNPPPAS